MASRKKVKAANIVLYHKTGIALVVIEAKANKFMQQVLGYAELLEVLSVFSTNVLFHDKTNTAQIETETL